jgi:nitrate reductase (NAD(P)H)
VLFNFASFADARARHCSGWWHREEFVYNELNVNSVIAVPAHDARVMLAPPGSGGAQPGVELRGYAYSGARFRTCYCCVSAASQCAAALRHRFHRRRNIFFVALALAGGGRQVTHVELTFDGGASWHLAALPSPSWERGTEHGRHWCAVQWSFTLSDARELLLADEVACRAWDSAFNTQPSELTWNLKGMGNNAWYRVRVHKEHADDDRHGGGVCLHFEAPVQPDGLKGGWMGFTPGGWKVSVVARRRAAGDGGRATHASVYCLAAAWCACAAVLTPARARPRL